jgi:hypothetical protein
MPLNANGDIAYRSLAHVGIRLQADPPLCNICQQVITRANFGWMSLEESSRGPWEWIACRACTPLRTSGPLLRTFVKRHGL